MIDLLDEWNKLDPLSDEEQSIILKTLHHIKTEKSDWDNVPRLPYNEAEWIDITNQYFNLMPCCELDPEIWHLTFNTCCSNFIRELFAKYVDDDTLVISSDCEHPTVKECLSNCKHTLILSQYTDIRLFNFNKTITELTKYKKVFVYIIAMRNDTGEITPQTSMLKLKELIKDKEHIMVLDDVQGMFFIPRDYTPYDYILGTGHVAVRNFNMGIMISKEYYGGIRAVNWAEDYLVALKIVLARLNKLHKFRYACNEYFKSYITQYNASQALAAPHVFYLKDDRFKISSDLSLDIIKKTNVLIMPDTVKVGGMRMRALGYINEASTFQTAIKIFKYMLENNKIDERKLKELLDE